MSEKILIIACSNGGIEYITDDIFKIYRSSILLDGSAFKDNKDITALDFYKQLREDKALIPSTALASTGEILELFEEAEKEGYTDVITITISSKLSGTYQNVILASSMVESDMKVHVIDSKITTYPQGYMTFVANEMVKENKSVEEILNKLDFMIKNNKIYFAVDSLKYLVKNGRLSGASGFVGGLLKIKPLLTFNEEGEIVVEEKIRTFKKALSKVLDKIIEETKGLKCKLYIVHADNEESVSFIKEQLNDDTIDVIPISPVIGAHIGPGSVGVGYLIEE